MTLPRWTLDLLLTAFGGEVWVWTPWPVWTIGACLAVFAGMSTGWWLVGRWR